MFSHLTTVISSVVVVVGTAWLLRIVSVCLPVVSGVQTKKTLHYETPDTTKPLLLCHISLPYCMLSCKPVM